MKKETGPYRQELIDWEECRHTSSTGRPPPASDPILKYKLENKCINVYDDFPSNYIFGFKNTKQYTKWFTKKERVNLFNLGFKLKRINVKEMINSNYQSIGVI